MIGKDEPSTVEYLKYEKIANSDSNSQMSKIDEECSSIISQTGFISIANEEMLFQVYGGNASKDKLQMTSKLDNGYYSKTSMSPKKISLSASSSDAKHLHSSLSGDVIQSSIVPYNEDAIALQEHSTLSPSDENSGNSTNKNQLPETVAPLAVDGVLFKSKGDNLNKTCVLISQLQSIEDPEITNNTGLPILTNKGKYIATVDQYNNSADTAPIDLKYIDYDAVVDQEDEKQAALLSHDAESIMIHKPLNDSLSFSYVPNRDKITSVSPVNDQFGVNYIQHDDAKEKSPVFGFSSHLHKVTANSDGCSFQATDLEGAYIDHSNVVQHNNITETTSMQSNSSTFRYMEKNDDGGYISES